jgi:hypothetical protein
MFLRQFYPSYFHYINSKCITYKQWIPVICHLDVDERVLQLWKFLRVWRNTELLGTHRIIMKERTSHYRHRGLVNNGRRLAIANVLPGELVSSSHSLEISRKGHQHIFDLPN